MSFTKSLVKGLVSGTKAVSDATVKGSKLSWKYTQKAGAATKEFCKDQAQQIKEGYEEGLQGSEKPSEEVVANA